MSSRPTKPRSLLVRTVAPVLGGVVAIAAIGGLLWGVAVFATDRERDDTDGFENRVGDETFEVPYDVMLDRIERDGAPVLFQDLLIGGHLDIYVNHVGDAPQEGWFVFEAKREGADRTCNLQWNGAKAQFGDPCTGDAYPPDGAGLRQFPTEIDEDGDLVIRLRPSRDEDTPTTTASTVPSVGG